jgi:hypothetical protein
VCFPSLLQATSRVTSVSTCGTYPAFMINRISCLLPLLVTYMFTCHLRQIKNICRIHLIRYVFSSIPGNFCFHITCSPIGELYHLLSERSTLPKFLWDRNTIMLKNVYYPKIISVQVWAALLSVFCNSDFA